MTCLRGSLSGTDPLRGQVLLRSTCIVSCLVLRNVVFRSLFHCNLLAASGVKTIDYMYIGLNNQTVTSDCNG